MLHHILLAFILLTSSAIRTMAASSEEYFVRFKLAGHGLADGAAFTLKVVPAWAPLGAARFRELVDAKFYDDQRFFRVLARRDSAEDFSRLNALLCTATDWIFIPAYCFAIP